MITGGSHLNLVVVYLKDYSSGCGFQVLGVSACLLGGHTHLAVLLMNMDGLAVKFIANCEVQ